MIPEPLRKPMPNPPRLHWGWVLAGVLLTRGLFPLIWMIVQANWARKVKGTSRAFVLSIVNACSLPAFFVLLVIEYAVRADQGVIAVISGLGLVGIVVLNLVTIYTLRYELESEPIGIPLGAVATFFLGTIYFQYHLHDYNVEDKKVPEGSLGLTSQTRYFS